MEKSIVERICYDCESLSEHIVLSDEYKRLTKEALEFYNRLNNLLNDEQKKIFEDFVDSEIQVRAEHSLLHFKEGLKTGLLLAIECLI